MHVHKCPHLSIHTVPGSMAIKLHKHLYLAVTSKCNMQYDDKIYFKILVILHCTCSQPSCLPHVTFMLYILPTDVRSNSIHGCIRVHKTLTYTNLQGNYSIWQFWGHQFLKLTDCVSSKSVYSNELQLWDLLETNNLNVTDTCWLYSW